MAEDASTHFPRGVHSSETHSNNQSHSETSRVRLPVNIYGSKVKVLLLDAREGAAGALYLPSFYKISLVNFRNYVDHERYGTATAESGVRTHGVVTGGGLLEMVPVLQKMQRERVPCVVHAAVASIADDLSIVPDLSDIPHLFGII